MLLEGWDSREGWGSWASGSWAPPWHQTSSRLGDSLHFYFSLSLSLFLSLLLLLGDIVLLQYLVFLSWIYIHFLSVLLWISSLTKFDLVIKTSNVWFYAYDFTVVMTRDWCSWWSAVVILQFGTEPIASVILFSASVPSMLHINSIVIYNHLLLIKCVPFPKQLPEGLSVACGFRPKPHHLITETWYIYKTLTCSLVVNITMVFFLTTLFCSTLFEKIIFSKNLLHLDS